MAVKVDTQKEIIFGSSDPNISRVLSKKEKDGELRKLAPRIYTTNLIDSPENIVRRNLIEILAYRYPNALISHRSAKEMRPTSTGDFFLTNSTTRRVANLPGIILNFIKGPKATANDIPFMGLHISGEHRYMLENMQLSRKSGDESRVLPIAVIENKLEQLLLTGGEKRLNQYRDELRDIANELGMTDEFSKINNIISALLSTHDAKVLSTDSAKARAAGNPFDANRVELFEILFDTIKDRYFVIQKVVKITIYDSLSTLKITSQKFTAEDDADYSSLIEDVRLLLKDNGRIETSFSVEFIYKEFESEANLFDKLLPGVSNIYKFLCALNQKIGDNSKLFHDIMNKVEKLNILKVNRTDLFVEDYVYYSSNDNFERGSRIELRLPKCRIPENKMFGMLDELGGDISLDNLGINPIDDINKLFLKIIIWHAFLYSHQNNHIMSTIILVYDDNTCEIQSPFDTTIRTTAYRKINEVADCIIQSKDPVKAVIVINEMWSYPNNGEVLAKNYEERVKTENPISLFACHMVDKCLNSYSYHFESDKVGSLSYVIDILKQDIDATIHMNFMNPVIKAFQSRLQI